MTRHPLRALAREERGLLAGAVVRLVLAFALLGLTANEVGQMILSKIRVENAASAAAQAGANVWKGTSNSSETRQAAQEAAANVDPGATITRIQIAPQGVVVVDAKETANTLLLRRVSFLRHYGVQTAEQQQTPG